MSVVQQLVTDLSNLSTEAKRRSTDVKSACDKALSFLKQHYGTPTLLKKNIGDADFASSTEIKKDLSNPFILSLLNGNVKFATISIPVLHRLIISKIIPVDSIQDLLDSLSEASKLAIDIQLRTLQCLPTVMQVYKEQLRGEPLLKLLSICSNLTSNKNSAVVINTASATLQQLFSFVYDTVREADNSTTGEEDGKKSHSVTVDNNKTITLNEISYEGFRIFEDLCKLASSEKPTYLPSNIYISGYSVLELIENIVANHKELFQTHEELGFLLRQKVIPKLLRSLNEARNTNASSFSTNSAGSSSSSFPVVVRVMRIIQVLLSPQLLSVVEVESEVILLYMNQILSDASSTGDEDDEISRYWSYMVLEVYRNLFQDFKSVKSIFEKFDEKEGSNNCIQDLLSILTKSLSRDRNIQQTDILQPVDTHTSSSSTANTISRHSSMKVSILDHLDKSEFPNSNIPPTYPSYLLLNIVIILSEGIAKFVSNLSSQNQDPKTLEQDVEFISTLIEATFNDLSQTFKIFLYTVMDNESFHSLIRSIQKYTHTTGLLGLGGLRDKLLAMISEAITKNVEQKHEQQQNNHQSTNSDEVSSGILSIGESIVESLYQDKSQNDNTSFTLRPRKFNSRHVTCFRALVNLAVSLGSTLEKSWDIIWVSFQWCDYFINGPDDLKRGKAPEELNPRLVHQDFVNIENSKRKFYESIRDYQIDSYYNLISALTKMSSAKDVTCCPYNPTYFMKQVVNISSIEATKFLIGNDKTWPLINEYFIKNIANRTSHYNLRIQSVQMFNSIIDIITTEGFKDEKDKSATIHKNTASKSLHGLMNVLDEIFNLGKSQELLVVNCETEIHLLVLTSLHQLIDKYDKYYQNSWDIVFKILNTPFNHGEHSEKENSISKSLLDSSFGTLKLILDEFIFSLPFDQIKILIDTLYNFCKQRGDLNISFSAVSYFWLIGDSIKKKVTRKEREVIDITSEEQLINSIGDVKDGEEPFELLDVYLLSTLSKISNDSRAQVRDGAIQTFFQIIDVHGVLFSSRYWKVVYKLVLVNFLHLELSIQDSNFNKKEWIESLNLVLCGLISVYNTYLTTDQPDSLFYWTGLVEYFQKMLQLKWIDLNVLIFKSFNDCLIPMREQKVKADNERSLVCDLLFRFWIDIPIEYDFINPLYQESLTKLMNCFPYLYDIIKDKLTLDDTQRILNNFNSCARYPVLQEKYLDDKKPSKLQQAVYENFKSFDESNDSISSLIIQSLSNIIVFPFATRARIEQKIGPSLQGKQLQTPTFIAISSVALDLLKSKLLSFGNFKNLINDKGVSKVMKSLIEVVNSKFEGRVTKANTPLWIEANEILRIVIVKVIESTKDDDISVDLWKLIIASLKLTFDTKEFEPEFENSNIEHYFSLIDIVLPRLTTEATEPLISDFVEEIYNNSFLFAPNELEESLLKSSSSIEEYANKLSKFDFDESFGSTEPLKLSQNKKTSIVCLKELIKFASTNGSASTSVLNEKSLEYFVCRSSFCLRRYVADVSLLYRAPLPQVQQEELLIIVEGILKVNDNLTLSGNKSTQISKLYPLLAHTVPYASRITGLSQLIEGALLKISS